MIGMNDVTSEVFTIADVDTVIDYAVSQGLAGVHFWSLDRDTPCRQQRICLADLQLGRRDHSLQYTNRFLQDLGR